MKNIGDVIRNFLKKSLDKCLKSWYSIEVACGRGGMADTMVLGAIASACGFKSRRPHHSRAGEQYVQMWRNWQTRYFEVVVSIPRVGSSPVICTILRNNL